MPLPLRVVLVDDDALLRALLTAHLELEPGLEVVEVFTDVDGLAAVPAARPDVVVLDNEMPSGLGLDALPALRLACPRARIVMWSGTEGVAEAAVARGADAFVDKGQPVAQVVAAALQRD